jgi:hypothetical protein
VNKARKAQRNEKEPIIDKLKQAAAGLGAPEAAIPIRPHLIQQTVLVAYQSFARKIPICAFRPR